jgi:3-hydroxybutyryl-CoA dehydrogenase
MDIKNVGVVGCGQMGGGIAQVCAEAGYRVIVSEINKDMLRTGLASIETSLDRSVKKKRMTPQKKDKTLGRIIGTTYTGDFRDCDLIIEATPEKLDLKRKIFSQIDRICPEHAIMATNTSSLLIRNIAVATRRPDKVLGMHFFNPVPAMKLIELVRAATTSDATIEAGRQFGESLGKTVVTVRDSPGFIVNRLMTIQIINAIKMVESGMASREDIDTSMTLGLNHPTGPLALADLIGLDTVLEITNNIHDRLRDKQYAAPTLLKKMVAAGQLGQKTGRGFYEYD